MIPYRCMKRIKKTGKTCFTRKSMKVKVEPSDVKCPKCGSPDHWYKDVYRVVGRKTPNADNAERCDCGGTKSKKENLIQYHDGVRVIRGPHRKGQRGCIHHPQFGIPEQDMIDEPPTDEDKVPF